MKKLMLRTVVALLVLPVLFFAGPSSVRAEEMTCPDHVMVEIDIKPADASNKINLSAKGLLPVAVLSTDDFDASQFTPHMAHLSDASIAMTMGCVGADAIRWNLDDVNGDGRLDLVFFFKIQDLNLTSGSNEATLMAHDHFTDIHIIGTDTVVVKP